jgi:hypothetical protein
MEGGKPPRTCARDEAGLPQDYVSREEWLAVREACKRFGLQSRQRSALSLGGSSGERRKRNAAARQAQREEAARKRRERRKRRKRVAKPRARRVKRAKRAASES